MPKHTPQMLAKVERELERIGLLLEHDQALPSVTSIVAGEPIRGSWWGHALGHVIYDLIGELGGRSGALDAKLVDGKVTYVHPRLWPAFFALSNEADDAQLAGLGALERKLLSRVRERGPQRLDALQREGFASGKELTAAARALERRILVHAASVHTDSGAHAKVLKTWPAWLAERGERVAARTREVARQELASAVDRLAHGRDRVPKLAWRLDD